MGIFTSNTQFDTKSLKGVIVGITLILVPNYRIPKTFTKGV